MENNDSNMLIQIITYPNFIDTVLNVLLSHSKTNPRYTHEILWILVNVTTVTSTDVHSHFMKIVSEVVLNCLCDLYKTTDSCYIIDSIFWLLRNISYINTTFRETILNHSITDTFIQDINKAAKGGNENEDEENQCSNVIDLGVQLDIIKTFAFIVNDIDYSKYKRKIKQILNIACQYQYDTNRDIIYWSFFTIANISELNCSTQKLITSIIKQGVLLKIKRLNFKKFPDLLGSSLKILGNLLSGNDNLIEEIMKLNIIDFYDIQLINVLQLKQLQYVPYILLGLANISGTRKDKLKLLVLQTTLFQEGVYKSLLYISKMHKHMLIVILNLSFTRSYEVVCIMDKCGVIDEVDELARNEKDNKEVMKIYLRILFNVNKVMKESKENEGRTILLREKFKEVVRYKSIGMRFLEEEMEEYVKWLKTIDSQKE